MVAKTFEAQYEIVDFNLYLSEDIDRKEVINIVDFVIEESNVDFIKKEFNGIFVIDNDKLSYLFSGYKIKECYPISGNLIRVICVKE